MKMSKLEKRVEDFLTRLLGQCEASYRVGRVAACCMRHRRHFGPHIDHSGRAFETHSQDTSEAK